MTTPKFRILSLVLITVSILVSSIYFATNNILTNTNIQLGELYQSKNSSIQINELDFTPEPGAITQQEELDLFFQRQTTIFKIAEDKNEIGTVSPTQLHYMFWIQILVGLGAVLISGTVWSFRPKSFANTIFLTSGFATLLFTSAAAIYTTRFLAIDPILFKVLLKINEFGASLYGITTLSLFCIYPTKLKHSRWIILSASIFFGSWTLLSMLGLLPIEFNVNLVTLVEMIGILFAIIAQALNTRNNPRERAALYWVGLSVLIGAGSFILLNALPLSLGMNEPILDQGSAFLLFLLIYIGVAFGLIRFRLFDVGRWSFNILFYAIGITAIFLLDSIVIMTIGVNSGTAISLSVILVSLLYLPLREYGWKKLSNKKNIDSNEILNSVLLISLEDNKLKQKKKWKELLNKLFSPLEIIEHQNVQGLKLSHTGVDLFVPAVFDNNCFEIKYPAKGKILFSTKDLDTCSQIISMMKNAQNSKTAFEEGEKAERRRLAQDLHDDLGSQLLTGIYQGDEQSKKIFRDVLNSMRTMVSDYNKEQVKLSELLPLLRFEAVNRLSLVNITSHWPLSDDQSYELEIPYIKHKALSSCIKEIVSNIIKHSKANKVLVNHKIDKSKFIFEISDNGNGIKNNLTQGNGLKNIKRRMQDAGGEYQMETSDDGTKFTLCFDI